MSFQYDLFISYSHEDSEWAEKLNADLAAKYIRVYLDRRRLQAGVRWEEALLQALLASRHLVVLWSPRAKDSDWVTRERGYFDAQINKPLAGGAPQDRRLMFVLFDDEPMAYSSFQMITDLKDTGAYARGVANLNPLVWQQVLKKIEDAILENDPRSPILQAILTTTGARLAQINPAVAPPLAQTLNTFLSYIGIGSIQQVGGYYGYTRGAWRPFGSLDDVGMIMDRLLNEINARSHGEQFRWEPISDEFWSNDQGAVDRQISRLASNRSVVVIDPLALYDDEVRARLARMEGCFANPKALIMLLAPYKLPSQIEGLRQLAKDMVKQAFDRFYEFPERMGRVHAYCAVHVEDDLDARRWLRMVLGPYLGEERAQTHPYTDVGGGA